MPLITRFPRRDLLLFLSIALVLIGAGIGLRDPWPADEPRFALMARHMVESGNWLFPMRGNELYSDKPPLFMWMQAVSYLLVGNWRIAFLLPALLAALGTLVLVYDIGRRLWNHRIGLHGAYALLFAIQFAWQFKKAQIDPVVTFFIVLACWALLRHFLLGPRRALYGLGWFSAGLGTITKGVGVIALLMCLPALLARALGWRHLAPPPARWRWVPIGWPLFLLAVGLWIVPMLLAVDASSDPALRAYADDILMRQTAGRYANSWHHHNPPWYFGGVMLTLWQPLVLALPWAIPAWWRRLKRRDARYLLPLGWVALVLLFFSIPSGKRDLYILPALPMFCLALAPLLPGLLKKRAVQRLAFGFGTVLGGVLLLAGAWALLGEPKFALRLAQARGFGPDFTAPWWMLLCLGATMLALLAGFGQRRGVAGLMAALFALWCALGLWAQPMLNPSSSASALMQRTAQALGPDTELGLVGWTEQNLLQADRAATTFGFRRPLVEQRADAIAWLRQAPQRRRVMILEEGLRDCIDADAATPLGAANRRQWWLFGAEALAPVCGSTLAEPEAEPE